MNQLLTLPQASRLCGIDWQVLRIHVLKGNLVAHIRTGPHRLGHYDIAPSDLATFIEKYRAGEFDGRRFGNNRSQLR